MARSEWESWLQAAPERLSGESNDSYLQRCEVRDRLRSLYQDMIEALAQEGRRGGNAWALAAYAVWRAMPRALRQPRTQADLAHLLGFTSEQVFYKWMRQHPDLFVQSSSGLRAMIHEFLPDVLWASISSATHDGAQGFQDRKMLLSIAGMTTDKGEHRLTGDLRNPVAVVNLDELTDEELARLAQGG